MLTNLRRRARNLLLDLLPPRDACARAVVRHHRPTPRPDGTVEMVLVGEEVIHNVITNVGRVQLHTQGYGTSGLLTNGFNYVALSNDALTETATSTVLSTEIAANGLSRAQGTVTLPTGSGNQTTVAKIFTCATTSQAAQKAALFTAASSGVMNHALAFTQRTLQVGDTLSITFTITLG